MNLAMKPHDAFREWFNDFLTVSAFAEWHGIGEEEARRLIEEGRKVEYAMERRNA